ncbi:MAG TPA: NHL repeat-containing protein [Solirubrobacteraceae bacterium]|nr:NHL repeat-containing protein [Solirubrobacteraceae bacterium]
MTAMNKSSMTISSVPVSTTVWRRLMSIALTLLVVLAAWLALSASPAVAKVTHTLEGSFKGSDVPHESLGLPLAVAVDNSTGLSGGDVYVGGPTSFGEPSTVYKFDEEGAFAGIEFTGTETPQGSFGFINWETFASSNGLAVDGSAGASAGDVYVADAEHNVVDRFDEAGKFLCQITGTETPSVKECAGPTGSETPEGGFTPGGVAVNPTNGYVYVSDSLHKVIDVFTGTGEYVDDIADSHLTQPYAIAFNSAGELYVTNASLFGGEDVVKFDAKAKPSFVSLIDSGSSTDVAVDPFTNGVYVYRSGEENQIAEYDSAGRLLDTFGKEQQVSFESLAVSSFTGKVYLTTFTGGEAFIYGPTIVIPDVTTGTATSVQETNAIVSGHLDPDTADGGSEITACTFEYITGQQFNENLPSERYKGASVGPCEPAAPYSTAVDVSSTISVLPSTIYHFRLHASNASGSAEGEDETFTTPGPPVVEQESASVDGHTATVRALVSPFGSDTTCQLQYLTQADFEASGYAHAMTLPCAAADVGSGFGSQKVEAVVAGLSAATMYHFHFVASSKAGVANGADEEFATFGPEMLSFESLDASGHPQTQAGSHPYAWITRFAIASTKTVAGSVAVPENVKDVRTELPPGFIGDPSATAKCTRGQLAEEKCSGASQIGELTVMQTTGSDLTPQHAAVYNMVPPSGVPAELGAKILNVASAYIDATVRTGGDYGVTADVRNISTGVGIAGVTLELWGVPGDPSHDINRACPSKITPCPEHGLPKPFLTNPTSCVGAQSVTIRTDSWQYPDEYVSRTAPVVAINGCEKLDFTPVVEIAPGTSAADSPSGLHVDLGSPQNDNPLGLAEAELRETKVTLPTGMTASPSAATGLQACTPTQIGLNNPNQPACPDASKIGGVEISTPLLADPLKGSVFLAQQNNNPFGSLLAIYVTAEADGALVKLAGHVEADPLTGQLTTTFNENPQLPFNELKLDLFGGPSASLDTPESCGSFTSSASLTPWSGTTPVSLSSPFQISSGCVSGFSPAFTAGTTNPHAGASSPFTLSFSRNDSEEELAGASVALPPGLVGKLASVAECSDTQLAFAAARSGAAEEMASSCPASSQLGSVRTYAGPGPSPVSVSGKVYLTGPYKGAPFGLAVIVPAIAGPFDLGTVVIRQALHVDPSDAHVTDVSDPFPTILQGIPLRLKRVDVTLDRPQFMLNPTSCTSTAITATLTSTGVANAAVSSPFQVSGCRELPFKPALTAFTQGRTSKANGASLTVRVSQKPGEANIHKVQLQIPGVLPARNTTLNQACTEAQFNASPAGCPQGSFIGTATARTKVLTAPLTGPAILVSHGGAAFPDVEFVLQGEGVQVILDGKTDIKKVGRREVTFSRFETVPDAPITSFETVLPEGPHSILTASENLCALTKKVSSSRRVAKRVNGHIKHVTIKVQRTVAQPLVMPTKITGQNGAQLTQSTKIAITGCAVVRHRKRLKHRSLRR